MRILFLYLVISGLLVSALFADDIAPMIQRFNLAPAVPGKVVRYVQVFIQRYDTNADEILQREEWDKMPGSPQAIDIDGNGQITSEELVLYFAHYAQSRSIHRTMAVDLSEPYKFDPANLKLFRPALLRATAPQVPSMEIQKQTDDATEDMIKLDDQPIDDDAYEKMLMEHRIPADRPFYASPENLRGVPAWFILRDKNGDGQISLREFAPTLSSASVTLFKRLDKNGNRFIEPEEVRVP